MEYSLRDGKGGKGHSIKEIKLNGVTIGIFAGSRGHIADHDIIIKYQEDGKFRIF